MPFMTWTDALSVGSAEIDNQHKKLIELVNRLHDAMRTGQGHETLTGIFEEVLAYTDYHFKTEERIFNPLDYPQKLSHLHQHQDLLDQTLRGVL